MRRSCYILLLLLFIWGCEISSTGKAIQLGEIVTRSVQGDNVALHINPVFIGAGEVLIVAEMLPEGSTLESTSVDPIESDETRVVWAFAKTPPVDVEGYEVKDGIPPTLEYSIEGSSEGISGMWGLVKSGEDGPITDMNIPGGGSGGAVDCTINPTDPSCTGGGSGGAVDCGTNPADPSCTGGGSGDFCMKYPNDPACGGSGGVDCVANPKDPSCGGSGDPQLPSDPSQCNSGFDDDLACPYVPDPEYRCENEVFTLCCPNMFETYCVSSMGSCDYDGQCELGEANSGCSDC